MCRAFTLKSNTQESVLSSTHLVQCCCMDTTDNDGEHDLNNETKIRMRTGKMDNIRFFSAFILPISMLNWTTRLDTNCQLIDCRTIFVICSNGCTRWTIVGTQESHLLGRTNISIDSILKFTSVIVNTWVE